MHPSLADGELAKVFGELVFPYKCALLHLWKLLEPQWAPSGNSVKANPQRDPKHKLGCESGSCGFPLLMSPGWGLNPDHNAGDVCLRPAGCSGFSQLNRLITINRGRGRKYTAAMYVDHTAPISGLGLGVYCLLYSFATFRRLFGCITDPNLTFERVVEGPESCNRKKEWPFYVCWQHVDPSQRLRVESECLWFHGLWVWKHLRESRGRLNFLCASFISLLFSKY